jgi:hypothetical protein
MTPEERKLLLKDLSARLPYGVWVRIDGLVNSKLTGVYDGRVSTERGINYPVVLVKPYLRPMSSMTEEEKEEIDDYLNKSIEGKLIGLGGRVVWLTDYYLSHHLDYRGLIGKGLALEANKGMYNLKNQQQ